MKLYCIGIGPGGEEQMTLRAMRALEKCDCVAGYGLYLDLIENLISGKERIESGMTREVLRCKAAVEAAKQGKTVAVVSSGDAGVYGMASLLLELCEHEPNLEVEVIPGITAACSGGAVLGSPLTCDFACISLSDLLTPWETIERRLDAAASAASAWRSGWRFLHRAVQSVKQKAHRPSAPCLRYSAGDRTAGNRLRSGAQHWPRRRKLHAYNAR